MSQLIAGNWKMNGAAASGRALARALAERASGARAEIALCPPAPLLPIIGEAIAGSGIKLGAQDCHPKEKGAHTGDVSAWLLADLGCSYVIVGHSERRADHGETDTTVAAKAAAALKAGLVPIVCVGETESERERGETSAVIRRQVENSIPPASTGATTVIAYEPVWAIGTGKTATTEDIVAVHDQIRTLYAARWQAAGLRILYGGSVKAGNAQGILACRGVDGALVGGASLDAEEFWRIIEAVP
jgi:triosephosphate isomerase